MHPRLTSVISSNIAGYGFNPATQELFIEFQSGRIYRYKDVAANVVEAFKNASSKGSFFNATIKDSYATDEVTAEDVDKTLLSTPQMPPKQRKRRRPSLDLAAYPWFRAAVI